MASSLPPCRLCHSPAVSLRFTVRTHRIGRCATCGFVQVVDKPTPEQLREIYAPSYFVSSKYDDEATLLAESARRLDLLRCHAAAGTRQTVLDAGCATGDFLEVAKHDYDMYGIELSEHAAQVARQRNPELGDRIYAGSLETGLPDRQFDAICLWDVIEHVWDPAAVCVKLLEHLRPGGHLLFSTPAADAPVAHVMGARWAFMTPPEHLSFFSRRSIEYLFGEVLASRVLSCERKGKRANVGFVLYKLRRVFPFVPDALVRFFRQPLLAKWAVYVPTGDVQYVVVQKPMGPGHAGAPVVQDDSGQDHPMA